MEINVFDFRPAGYSYLLEKFALAGMPNWHSSSVSTTGTHFSKSQDGFVEEVFRTQYWPGEKVGDHLEFALKYDGINLGFLDRIFEKVSQDELTEYIKSKPTGKYARRIWFFHEFLTGKQLPVDDLTSGNYVDALEAKDYYTVQNGEKSSRHRIVNNLLSPKTFYPVVRRTEKLSKLDSSELRKKCEDIVTAYPPELLRRSLSYLYNKETKSSFEIEHIKPNTSRTEKFITSLALAEKEDFCEKERLIGLQNRIVDPRFKDIDYRLDEMGQMTVENDTACWYQYMDMTSQSETLYEFVTQTIEKELVEALNFLANYDNNKKAIQDIIDMPDRLIDRFIKLTLQNNGSLSARKKADHFDFLTDEELSAMEQAVKDGYNRPD